MSFSLNNIFNKLKKRSTAIYAIIILAFAIILTVYLVQVQIRVGVIYWDVYLYLNNALMFAGLGEGYKIYLPPLLPFLTSLVYRLGHVGDGVLYAISGIIFVLGIYGMYLLLKLRFSTLESVGGAVIFSSFTIILSWAVSGTLDVPAVCFSIWFLYLTIYGLEKNSKALYLVFPVAALAFLTRYTAGLMLLPVLFIFMAHYLEKGYEKAQIKKLVLGMVVGLLIMIPFMGFFYTNLGTPFPFLDQLGVSVENHVSTRDPGLMPDKAYYLKNIPNYISSYPLDFGYGAMFTPVKGHVNPVSYIILILTSIGLIASVSGVLKIYGQNLIASVSNIKSVRTIKEKGSKGSKKDYIKYLWPILIPILLLLFILSLWGKSYLISEALMLVLVLSIYLALKKQNLDTGTGNRGFNRVLDLAIIIWFLTYFISHSFLSVKVDRYFVTMIPAMVYLIVLGLSSTGNILARLSGKLNHRNIISGVLVLLMAVMLFSSSIYPYQNNVPYPIYGYLEEGGTWMADYDPDYADKIIFSNQWPAFSWYLKTSVQRGFPSDFKTSDEFAQMLKKSNATYYIGVYNGYMQLNGYKRVGNTTEVYFFQRINASA